MKKELTKKHKVLYKGKILNFCVDTVILPNSKTEIREYTSHPEAVAILPFLDKKNVILVRQYRYPTKKFLYEIPAGKVRKGEKVINCVKRELLEETGYKSKYIKKLISFYPTPAFSDEILHIFVAKKLVPFVQKSDEDEFLEKIVIPFKEAIRWVKTGKIRDAKSITSILFVNLFNARE